MGDPQAVWNVSNIFRLVNVVVLLACITQMVMMLAYYYHTLIPKTDLVRAGQIVAPPVWWTFIFYIAVVLILMAIVATQVQAVYSGARANALTYLATPVFLLKNLSVNRFLKYYSRNLNDALSRQRGFPVEEH